MNSKSVYLGVVSNVFGNLLMLGATLWLTRLVSAEEFGQFRVGANFATLLVPFLALGGERLLSRALQTSPGEPSVVASILATVFTIAGTGTLLLLLGYPWIAAWALDGNVGFGVYLLSVLLVPLTITYNQANTIWRHIGNPAAAQVHLNFAQRVLRAPLLIGTALAWPHALASSLSMLVAQTISLFQVRKHLTAFPMRLAGPVSGAVRRHYRELLLVGLPIAFMAAVDRLDVLLVNAVMGVADAGSYDLAFMLALTAMFPAQALSKTTEPMLLALAGDVERRAKLRSLQTRAFMLSCGAVFGIAVFAPLLAHFLGNAGPQFAPAALLLAAGFAFSGAFGPVLEYMQINGRSRMTMLFVIVLLALFFVLKYLAASHNSLVVVAGLAGLFYFVLRGTLAIYIYLKDRIVITGRRQILFSALIYSGIATYVLMRNDFRV